MGVGDLTGREVAVAANTAMLLGALRGMALSGIAPGPLLTWLGGLLDACAEPTLGNAVCCRYDPATRTLTWARAGRPAPLLFRDGTGRVLKAPAGVPLGTNDATEYGQAEETLRPGDVVLLYSGELLPGSATREHGHTTDATVRRLLGLAPHLGRAGTAQDAVRVAMTECGAADRESDACVVVARVR
jgi:hypothetical protein